MTQRSVRVYSARDAPDLGPIYRLFEGLTDIHVELEKIHHSEAVPRALAERDDPRADLIVMNAQGPLEAVRHLGVFDPYPAEVARSYEPYMRADDHSWVSFNAWPRVALVNRQVLPDPQEWPAHVEELAEPRYRGLASIAGIYAGAPVTQVSAMRAVKGDGWTWDLVDRWLANGMRLYRSNDVLREALIADRNGIALVNDSNYHVFLMAGQPVGEAWLDQGPGEIGTLVDGHSLAILRGAPHPDTARDLVDFMLSTEVQTLLARMYGETPVNPCAVHGPVRPLAEIRRMEVPVSAIVALRPSTLAELERRGFDL